MSSELQEMKDDTVTYIQPSLPFTLGIRDVINRRELLFLFVSREISSRYRQMLLGVLWAMLEPLGLLLLMTLVFGFLLRVDTGGYPYPVYAFSGMAVWLLFSKATMAAAGSLQDNMGLISKVYFPRLILPLSAVLREFFDALLVIIILLVLAFVYGYPPTFRLIVLPIIMLYASLIAMAVGLLMSSVMVKFRDIRPMLSLALQAGMYATPILYSANLVPEKLRFYYELNPMLWVVEISRWALLGKELIINTAFYWSAGAVFLMLFCGLIIFSMFERKSVDVQ